MILELMVTLVLVLIIILINKLGKCNQVPKGYDYYCAVKYNGYCRFRNWHYGNNDERWEDLLSQLYGISKSQIIYDTDYWFATYMTAYPNILAYMDHYRGVSNPPKFPDFMVGS